RVVLPTRNVPQHLAIVWRSALGPVVGGVHARLLTCAAPHATLTATSPAQQRETSSFDPLEDRRTPGRGRLVPQCAHRPCTRHDQPPRVQIPSHGSRSPSSFLTEPDH